MSGTVTQFPIYKNSGTDDGTNTAGSIDPVVDGEAVQSSVLNRPGENLRQRTEVLKNIEEDSLYLRDADRTLIISGPGQITWPGSTTASASGIPVLSDVLYIIPMLTPGHAQTKPIPPVASSFGYLYLDTGGSLPALNCVSNRRSYAAGDQINITVVSGASFSCTLGADNRTVTIVAPSGTTLGTTASALNALTPPSPDNVTPLLTVTNLFSPTDLLAIPQATQYVQANYDGEGHAITPSNLASFFSSNPGQALAEGDTLALSFATVTDTNIATTGGRRQAIPENSNTASISFFNSRIVPQNIVNSLPICKVINNNLVFGTGAEIVAGSFNASLAASSPNSAIIRNGGFESGVTSGITQFAITDWEPTAGFSQTGGNWSLSTTGPNTGSKCLVVTASSGNVLVSLQQNQEIPILPGQIITVTFAIKQLIAPLSGAFIGLSLTWGDLNSTAASAVAIGGNVTSSTDSVYRIISQAVTVPSGKFFLKSVRVDCTNDGTTNTFGSTGVAVAIDDVQVSIQTLTSATPSADNRHVGAALVDGVIIEDPLTYAIGQNAAALTYAKASPANAGTLTLGRKDQTYSSTSLPPALAILGQIASLGMDVLYSATGANLARISAPFLGGVTGPTLLWESLNSLGSATALRIYASSNLNALFITTNASFDGTNWNKDAAGSPSTQYVFTNGVVELYGRDADTAWSTWSPVTKTSLSRTTTAATPNFAPLLEMFDSAGNRRVGFDHNGLRLGRVTEIDQNWQGYDAFTTAAQIVGALEWNPFVTGTGINAPPGNSIGYRNLHFTTNASGSTAGGQSGLIFIGTDHVNILRVIEWEIDTTVLVGTGNNQTLEFGFAEDQFTIRSAATGQVKFSKTSTSSVWELVTADGSGGAATATATTVTTTTGVHRFRIELYGTGLPGGWRVEAYIDGVLAAEATTNLPNHAGELTFMYCLTSTGTVTTFQDVLVYPVKYRATRYLSEDAL